MMFWKINKRPLRFAMFIISILHEKNFIRYNDCLIGKEADVKSPNAYATLLS